MSNDNGFNYSSENVFKKSSEFKGHSSFSRSIFIPFISGMIGTILVLGICFGIPSIRSRILNNKSPLSYLATTSADSIYPTSLVNLAEYSETSIAVADKVLPSIVGITVNYSISVFGRSGATKAGGSGIIITEDGYIVTNNHVISSESSSSFYTIGEASDIEVYLYNNPDPYKATIVGTDSYTDLAIIKIETDNLIPAMLGNSNDIKVGEFSMAIGNPLGMNSTVTCGIISAVNREVSDGNGNDYIAIQTDAAINSGNSGGALVNSKGEVIGINTLKLSGIGVEGIGFAIPISSTTEVVDQLIKYQTVKRPYIGIAGIEVDSVTSEKYKIPKGVYVQTVEKDSPAEIAGLKESDVIMKIEGTNISNVSELNKIKYKYNIGDTVTLTISRNNEEMEIKITLVETPAEIESIEKNKTNEQESEQYNRRYNDDDFSSFFELFR